MEVDVVINGQLAENAATTDEHHKVHNVDRRTLSKNKKYHVFFCYRDVPNDKLWVKETVKKLENDFGYICCDHERDFLAGTKVMSNIKYGIKNSEKVVCVLSKEGLDSGYLGLETEMAHKESIDKRENLLIPVLLDDCEIPEELKLLTYIDARKEINETTWWPKLIAAIESKAEYSFFKGRKEEETKDQSENQPTYYFQTLCSLTTTFSCKQCSVQSTSKYIPKELASMDAVIPVETIKNIKRDLLDAPRIKRQQKCSCFCNGLMILFWIICFAVFVLDVVLIIGCATTTTISKEDCFLSLVFWVGIEIIIAICCGVGYRCYCKVPRSFNKKIAEYNTELIKNGILLALVHTNQWQNVSIVFYRVSFDSCKQYISFHLREDRQAKRETIVNISETKAQYDADDVPLLTRFGNEDLAQATKTLHCRNDMKLEMETVVDISEMQENRIAEDVPLLDVSENDQPDETTAVYPQNGLRQNDDDQGSAIINLNDQENRPQEFTQNSQFPHSSDLGDIENVAMTLLLKYALEYLRLWFKGKITNPKEDRHIADHTCLCQYIEKTDKKFRNLVDKNKIIHAQNSSIEHSTINKLDAIQL